MEPVCVADYERLAGQRLEPGAFGYFAGGAGDELALAANAAAWGRLRLRPRVLVDVSEVSTATTVLGTPVSMPLLVAPTAIQRLAHPEAEPGMARAAAAAGTLLCLSTLATATPAGVAAAAPGAPRWFQLYVFRDRGVTRSFVDQATEHGYGAIVLTVDAPGESRRIAAQLVRRLGDRLAKEGYRGFFEVDVLVDTDTDDVYLGELNPRISGASSITNVTAGAYADVPLFLFHILEYMNVDFDLDVDEINERWDELASGDLWSQMVMKETDDIVQRLTATPRTGQYSLDRSGALTFRRPALDWHQLQNESEAFFLRIYGPGDYRWKGADLGVVVTKGRLQVDSGDGKSTLAIRARHLIDSIRAEFAGTPISEPATPRTNVGVKSG